MELLFLIAIFLAAPLLTQPIFFFLIYQKKTYALYFPAIFLSCWSALVPPIGDQNRYFMFFQIFKGLPLDVFFNADIEVNFVTILCYVFTNLNINLEILRCMIVLFSYLISISIFRNLTDNEDISKKDYFLLFLVIFLSVPYSIICFGFRFGFACILFAGGMFYLLLGAKPKMGISFLILSMFTHFSFCFYVPFIFFFHLLKTCYQSKIIYLLLLIFTFLFGDFIFTWGYVIFQDFPFLSAKFIAYFDPDSFWALGFLEQRNWRGLLVMWFTVTPAILFFFIFYREINMFKYNYVMLGIFLLAVLCWNLPVMRNRILSVSIPIGAIFSAFLYLKGIMSRKCIVFLCLILLFHQVSREWNFRKFHDHEREISVLVLPLPWILMTHYDRYYVDTKITDDGDYFINVEY